MNIDCTWQTVRKRPVEVEAFGPLTVETIIPTLEGEMIASPGDFIIRGVKNELYPIKPDIFLDTYEIVD